MATQTTTNTPAVVTNAKTARAAKRAAKLAAAAATANATPAPVAPVAPAPAVAAGIAAPTAPAKTAVVARAPKIGVNPNAVTRAYYAGRAIAVAGHAAGINGTVPFAGQPAVAMAAAVGLAYGADIRTESEICLRNAWHAIRGYAAVAGITLPAAVPTATVNVPLTAPTAPATGS